MKLKNIFFAIVIIIIIAVVSYMVFLDETQERQESYITEEDVLEPEAMDDILPEEIFTEDNYSEVKLYLEKNIIEYAPESPVLGGTWYVTNVQFSENYALVDYEDGHIARKALIDFQINEDAVEIINIIKVFSDERDEINVVVGDMFAIALESNPTTGFEWSIGYLSGSVMLLKEGFISPKAGLLGASGIEYSIYRATDKGEDSIVLTYARPWESVQPSDVKTFSVVVE